jgi:nucleoside 2-deoxyribosyltransferase
MKAYLAIKFKGEENKTKVAQLTSAMQKAGLEPVCFVADYEKFGKGEINPQKLMEEALQLIQKCDLFIADLSDKGVGIGIESGYAYAKKIPIITIAKKGSDISETLEGISQKVFFYKKPKDITEQLKKFMKQEL